MKKRSRRKSSPISMRRILGETSTRTSKNKRYFVRLRLSDSLANLPMTIDQDEIYVSAEYCGGQLILTAYCNELVRPELGPEGGEYIIEDDEGDNV